MLIRVPTVRSTSGGFRWPSRALPASGFGGDEILINSLSRFGNTRRKLPIKLCTLHFGPFFFTGTPRAGLGLLFGKGKECEFLRAADGCIHHWRRTRRPGHRYRGTPAWPVRDRCGRL